MMGLIEGMSQTEIWQKKELAFESAIEYTNPIYDLKEFYANFISPSGVPHRINGFWDGEGIFKVRFAPTEIGTWHYQTVCSDDKSGLGGEEGSFVCVASTSDLDIYKRGSIKRDIGAYHLQYSDATPFFFTACTAWNGALKSTEEEWEEYLKHRVENNYNVIQFVTTQWRGCEKDSRGEVAFTGSGRINLNTDFFKRMDAKIDRINAHGLVAAPVLLWALPQSTGREFSPGYYLPQEEAIALARYMVARFGANQVIWILGGDGRYTREYEQRWKNIGRGVFADDPPGIVAQHPHGSLWIGEEYKDEDWLDIIGYQSSHNKSERVIDWINKGPMATTWDKLPPRPIINMEPNYEEIRYEFDDTDVRNASYWSIFATPISGIAYGHNGIWPWIQKEGEPVENHGRQGDRTPSTWDKAIDFPGSIQIGYLSSFIQEFNWWELSPNLKLLVHQPGNKVYNHFISLVSDDSASIILAYTPIQQRVTIRNPKGHTYDGRWFNPVGNKFMKANLQIEGHTVSATPPSEQDYILILER
ncbi:MAG: DUF4038 domain-containing protein [Saprospiraceae bacterium]|nr:DUF4038 domain-containing protein [Saprospiraceae bacterium]